MTEHVALRLQRLVYFVGDKALGVLRIIPDPEWERLASRRELTCGDNFPSRAAGFSQSISRRNGSKESFCTYPNERRETLSQTQSLTIRFRPGRDIRCGNSPINAFC